ncbi:TetR/AcrR family transcriptional regulator [Amycolatopsis australiensis]|uniref:DNA-binding transcriptional regulator, AcrR family n=1 Tax=Amycolatopsis australiensis TaxID=546364 RepID=A0A1K1SE38_9PSEU|nr:TetR/AcrR family transcriptional regulator [Amycolatopsis australiensis]SFW82574.1 DNA-binding transcriptional regulator, AcrR family [Amycolatopsis australiensis]
MTPAATDPHAPKPLRADARRNRARVLEAAERVFAAKGTGAPTEEVARAAGVGIGTVFRHFPTKEALLEAVLIARLHRFADEAESVAEAGSADPGATFFSFLTSWIEMSSAKNAYFEALAAAGVSVPKAKSDIGARLLKALGVLLSRAQAAGAVREDLDPGELITVIIGVAKAAEYAGPDARLRERAVAILFDGLRPRASAGERH